MRNGNDVFLKDVWASLDEVRTHLEAAFDRETYRRLYKEFAEEYYETEINISDIEQIYEHRTLTEELVSRLNQNVSLKKLKKDIKEIGYPNSE